MNLCGAVISIGRNARIRTRRFSYLSSLVLILSTLANGVEALDDSKWLTGVNISGGELNDPRVRINFDYTYPTTREIDYFNGKGLFTFRIPILSSRLFDRDAKPTKDWAIILNLISHAARSGSSIIVDLHQYGKMPSGLVGRDDKATSEFVAFWSEVSFRLKNEKNVIFGLMNEPHQQTAPEWLAAANSAIAAIRKNDAKQLILVPGSHWTGAHSWTHTDNAKVMMNVFDPENNFAFEVHQYLDSDSSGNKSNVINGAGGTRLVDFNAWARRHGFKAFLGEFGFASTPEALAEGRSILSFMDKNRDVWIGWTYWAAGPWWGDYMFSVEPTSSGEDRSQLKLLQFSK